MNEEAEYGKIHKNRNGPNIIGVATKSAASAAEATRMPSVPPAKKTVKNTVLVLYTPRPKDWGSWQIRLPYATSTVASPPAVHKKASQEEKGEEGELVYEPHSPLFILPNFMRMNKLSYCIKLMTIYICVCVCIYEICTYKCV